MLQQNLDLELDCSSLLDIYLRYCFIWTIPGPFFQNKIIIDTILYMYILLLCLLYYP